MDPKEEIENIVEIYKILIGIVHDMIVLIDGKPIDPRKKVLKRLKFL